VVCPSVRPSVKLVHHAKAVERNEMPFGRDTYAFPSNTVLDKGPSGGRGDFGVRPPPPPPLKFALQIAAKQLQIAE